MRELAPGSHLQKESDPARQSTVPHISLRVVTCLEVVSVIISILITVWAIIPFQPPQRWLASVPGLLALAMMINSHRVRGESLRDLGFTTRNMAAALQLIIWPTLIAGSTFAAIGYFNGSLHRTTHFWSTLAFLPFWGTLQQYVLEGFIYRRIRSLMVDENSPAKRQRRQIRLSIILTSSLFAFVHLPNPALTILTLVGGLVWSWVYERAPNLFVLGMSHASMSLILITSSPPWLLDSMSIGYKHFLYQKF
jgi:membrane protease YdiL (CAAX protease family)